MSLELRQVAKTIDNATHIYPTSLKLERGSFNILLGTTLSGKTTLMQLMSGLEKPTSGEVWFDGKNVTGVSVQKRNVSMVHQQFINYPSMSVFDNIASPLRVGKVSKSEIKRRVGEVAELLKISALLDRRPSELSGGQQQRTAMARALVKQSDLILLDEPLANLDFKLREEMRDELPKLFADRNCVVVYATTEPMEALLFGGKTATLFEGAVTDYGPSEQIYRQPADLTSARVFSEPPINIARIYKTGDRFEMNETVKWPVADKWKSLSDGEYIFAVRAHHVNPQRRNKSDVEIDARVQVAELSGSESMIHFDVSGQSWISLSHGIHPFMVGQETSMFADMAHGFLFDSQEKRVAVTNMAGSN